MSYFQGLLMNEFYMNFPKWVLEKGGVVLYSGQYGTFDISFLNTFLYLFDNAMLVTFFIHCQVINLL